MKKKSSGQSSMRLAWLFAFVLLLVAVLPLTVLADNSDANNVYPNTNDVDTIVGAKNDVALTAMPRANENITVTFTFDASVVAVDLDTLFDDMVAASAYTGVTADMAMPGDITVTVPAGSTVQAALQAAKAQTPFYEVGLDSGYCTRIGFIGSDILSKLSKIPVGNYGSGNVFRSAGWSYEINGVPGAYGMPYDIITEDNSTISVHYNLCSHWTDATGSIFYDQMLVDAYNDLMTAVSADYDTTDFSESKKAELDAALESAGYLIAEVDVNSVVSDDIAANFQSGFNNSGLWIGLYENELAMPWTENTTLGRLQEAKTAIDKAAATPPANILDKLYVGILMATTEEENLVRDFSADNFEYVILDYPNETQKPQYAQESQKTMFKYLYTPASTKANVAVALNGTDITPATLPTSYVTVRDLVWDNQYLNTLTFTVTPPAGSTLQPNTYTVKLYRELNPAEKLVMAKAESPITWATIKGANISQTAVTGPLTLPTKLDLPDGLGEVTVAWVSSNPAVVDNTGAVTRPVQDTQLTLTPTLTAVTGEDTASEALAPITVTVAAKTSTEEKLERMDTLMENIAASFTNNSGKWQIIDMAAYAKLHPATAHKTTADARQNYINTALADIQKDTASESDYAVAIIALQSLGADPQTLYPVNSNTAISAVAKLAAMEHSPSAWVAPYTFMAFNQGEYNTAQAEQALVAAVLANQNADGAWDEYGTIETTANMIIALAYYEEQPEVRAAIDKAVDYLGTQQEANGGYLSEYTGNNADSAALVLTALAAAGVDPDKDPRFIKEGGSLLDALLSFALADNSGFGTSNNTQYNERATYDSFRALIAAEQVMKTGNAFAFYDFSANQVAPARATGSGSEGGGGVKPDPDAKDIKITFTIKADTGYWMRAKSVTVPQGTSVMDAFLKAIQGTGITQQGADTGYVSSITYNGKTLGEFDGGPNSGWQYKVDGELPQISMDEYPLEGGEDIVLYFTEDWTTDPSSSGLGGGGGASSDGSVVLAPNAVVNGDKASTAVTAKDVEKVIAQAQKDNTDTIIIEPEITGKAAEVVVSLPVDSVSKLAEEKLGVTLNTTCGNLTLPAAALATLPKQAEGVDIRLSMAAKTAAPETAAAKQALAQAGGNAASVTEVTLLSNNKAITGFGGQEITVELPIDTAKEASFKVQQEYKVVVVSADGQVETLVGRCLRVGGRLVVQVKVSHLSTFIVTTAQVGEAASPFADVSADSWFYEAVQFVQQAGLMQGEADGRFNPNGKLNRAMLVTILYRLEQEPTPGQTSAFSDVKSGSWYADAVAWANTAGIVNGYEDNSFRPEQNISREELAAVLYRYEQLKGQGFTGAWAFKLDYADADQVAEWAYEALCWTTMNGLIQGDEAKNLNPQGQATRAETAVMLMRLLNK